MQVRRHRGRGGDDVLHEPGVAPLHREMQRGDRLGRVVELHAPRAAVRVDDELRAASGWARSTSRTVSAWQLDANAKCAAAATKLGLLNRARVRS